MKNHQNSNISDYIREIANYPLLTRQEEQSLARQIRDGDMVARDRLIKCNLRLVVWVAEKLVDDRVPIMDVIEEGNLGLIHAAELYKPGGGKFATYATYWIRQSIRQGIRKNGYSIRIPSHQFSQIQGGKTEPSCPRKADLFRKASDAVRAISVDPTENRSTPSCCENPYESVASRDEADFVLSRMGELESRERDVIRMRYGLDGCSPHTLKSIGKNMGLNRETVRQIEVQALGKLFAIARVDL